jgi:hypothetical protein
VRKGKNFKEHLVEENFLFTHGRCPTYHQDRVILHFVLDDEVRKSLLTPTQEKNDRLCDAMIWVANSMAEAICIQ